MDVCTALSPYPEILEVGESGVKGFHLGIHQLLDQRLLFFGQPLPSRQRSLDLFPLLPLDQGPPLLHSGIRHDHCELTEQVQYMCPCRVTLLQPPDATHQDCSYEWGQRNHAGTAQKKARTQPWPASPTTLPAAENWCPVSPKSHRATNTHELSGCGVQMRTSASALWHGPQSPEPEPPAPAATHSPSSCRSLGTCANGRPGTAAVSSG